MKHLIRFNESVNIYDIDWHDFAPKDLMIINSNGRIKFKLGNIMKHFDMVQVTYDTVDGEIWGVPDTLEFDVYFVKPGGKLNKEIRINVDITFGNLVVSEFSITSPDVVNIVQYTSYHSKFDPSNTVFAFDEESINKIIEFLNKFNTINVRREQFNFLDEDPNSYYPK